MTIKNSIIMICYNQEGYIKEALDSVLCEKVKPYEIIIGDDFSTDDTRKILTEYKALYPDIIKLVLNEKNLGIFANLNNLTPMVTGDMVHFLSGDDWYKPGFLENSNKKIAELNLDPNCTRFILLPNVVLHYPDGSEQVLKNDPKLIKKYSSTGLAIREAIHWRLVGLSRALFNNWPPFREDSEKIGPWSDKIQYVMLSQHIDKLIIMDCDGAVYRVGVGIASRTKQDELELSYYNALEIIHGYYQNKQLIINQLDSDYLLFVIKCGEAKINLSLTGLISSIFYGFKLIQHDADEKTAVKSQLYIVFRKLVSKSLIGIIIRRLRK